MSNDLAGVDDLVAEIALTRRARQRQLADASNALCGQRFTHPHWQAERDSNGYLVIDACACALPSGHGGGCVCVHNIERRVYRVDADGREHYATRPVVMAAGPWPRT